MTEPDFKQTKRYRAQVKHWQYELGVALRQRRQNRFQYGFYGVADKAYVRRCIEELRKLL